MAKISFFLKNFYPLTQCRVGFFHSLAKDKTKTSDIIDGKYIIWAIYLHIRGGKGKYFDSVIMWRNFVKIVDERRGGGGGAYFPKSRENDSKNYKNKPFEGTI